MKIEKRMPVIASFSKVSYDQFKKDWDHAGEDRKVIYEGIKLPRRATKGSAGYDFFSPIDFTLAPQETIKLPTGIRVKMVEGWVLQLFPRSSLGFKYRLQFNNTVGIIDEDYFYSDNEGHIFVKLMNDSNEGKTLQIKKGEALVQGIFLPFGICEDDTTSETRNGGFGSTNA